MPERPTLERARRVQKQGKAPTTQAGEFVREEMEHVRQGKHGVKSSRQAVAIGLSKARRAGVDLPAPRRGQVKEKTRRSQEAAYRAGQKAKAGQGTSTKRRQAGRKGGKAATGGGRRKGARQGR